MKQRIQKHSYQLLRILVGMLVIAAILLPNLSHVYGATYTWTKMPNGTGVPTGTQIKLPASKASISYNSAYTCKTKSYTNDDGTAVKALCVKITKNKAKTFTNVATIKYSSVRKIAGRSFDVTVTFPKVVVSARSGNNLSLGSDGQMCFARVYGNVIGISTDVVGQGAYKAQKQITTNVKVTWSGTSTVVPQAFYQGVKDIDAGYSSNYFKEAWQAGSGFASKLYYWPQCVNSRSTAGKMTTTGTSTSGNNQWYQTGLIAPTNNGTFTGTFTAGHCGSSLSLYSQYMDVPAPTKSVDRAKSVKGDTITWTVNQKIGTFYRNVFTPYPNFVLTDTLPEGVTYRSAKVSNSSGADITANGTLSYQKDTRRLTFTFSSSALANPSFYNGGNIRLTITTTAELPDTASKTISNQATSTISGLAYSSNTVTTMIQRPDLAITKTASKSEYQARESVGYTVTVKQTVADLVGKNVVVTDTLPEELTLTGEPLLTRAEGSVTVSGNTWTAKIPQLAYGQTATITFPAKAGDVPIEKKVTNTAKAVMEDVPEKEASATVQLVPIPLDITVEKVWEDGKDFYGLRPNRVKVQLLQDGAVIKEMELQEGQDWKGTFEDLPEYRTETERFVYTVQETELPDGYTAAVNRLLDQETEFQQVFQITNALRNYELELNKEMVKADYYADHGNATFLYQITSKQNPSQQWYEEISFTEADVKTRGSILRKSTRIELPYGEYEVQELGALRYQGAISATSGDVKQIAPLQAEVRLGTDEAVESVTYRNDKMRWDRYSHNDLVINQLQQGS